MTQRFLAKVCGFALLSFGLVALPASRAQAADLSSYEEYLMLAAEKDQSTEVAQQLEEIFKSTEYAGWGNYK